ncbi:membrane-bound PQQ-dependent dehydrogenase, glucose/quinate/shikimate family [Pectobacterium sp. 21LCBS03]|uniref:membrane-bound PQQ-dependent dehydrogenase, glucose/quinate/shikimate family n=1 Tax=Pectobacterium sp. 21LCBS03 TaxID=2935858 RepID=UPI00200F6527|nr:membrane-bound PQQ-dependent dehydrogenase, glucose/quinate/shikimate family [Pectobacterium sp. 21LCBS03]UPY96487.1 membrane-bound PQQ-dependent dehydrogenase, glucose/quinate/shikimate family [Pectobacterium sp. 21LCBS03]
MAKPLVSRLQGIWLLILGLIVTAIGAFFAYYGAKLIGLGGSPYFLVSGLVLLISGVLLWRKNVFGAYLYGAVLLGTVIWALWDVGLDFWPLVSRLLTLTGIAILVALSLPLLRNSAGKQPAWRVAGLSAGVLALAFVATVAGMFVPHAPVPSSGDQLPLVPVKPGEEQQNWSNYGNTSGASRFVALDQVTRDNVKDLQVAWTYRTGDVPQSPGGGGAEDQQTPLQVGNRLFLCTPHNNIIAVDATSGEQLWKTEIGAHQKKWMRCRGLAYFDATQPLAQPVVPGSTPVAQVSVPAGAVCQRRILMNSVTPELIAVDADTGAFCPDFGTNGRVDLSDHMGKGSDKGQYYPTSAPTLAGTTIVIGGRVADNVSIDMPGGVVRGFDVITGKLRWAFDPGNPQETTEPAQGQDYTRSTPNVWAPMSYDPQSNTVFMPTGSAAIDLWGVKRSDLDRKFGASMVAVDASTGQVKWVYQTVHDDLWDFDVPMQPSFVDFPGENGKSVPALVFGTKAGQLFVLDRMTGKPLTKVEERNVEQGDIPSEVYSPTQPVSVGMPQIGADVLKESDMWGATPFDQLLCRVHFKSKRYNGLFTPPGHDPSLNLPGSLGGMNWGGLSTDPVNNYLFVNDMRVGLEVQLVPTSAEDKGKKSDGNEAASIDRPVPLDGTPYSVNAKVRFMSPIEIPCQKPPFGTLTAVDLKTQKIAWQIPVGTVEDTGPFGIKMGLPIPIGMPTIGGTLATQGGLVFIASTQDYYLRAFDSSTGKEVWKARLPVGSQSTPISYKSPVDGKQYVVISAGGARNSPDRGDYVVAYRLP